MARWPPAAEGPLPGKGEGSSRREPGAAHGAARQEQQLFSMRQLALRPGLEMSLSQQKLPGRPAEGDSWRGRGTPPSITPLLCALSLGWGAAGSILAIQGLPSVLPAASIPFRA